MGNFISVCGNDSNTSAIYQNIRYKKAIDNFNKKLKCYNCYYHGDYNSYIYQLQAEFEYECMDPFILQGPSVGQSSSRFNDF